jgi:hypothetical protein
MNRWSIVAVGTVLIGLVLTVWSTGWLGFWLPGDRTLQGTEAVSAWRAKEHSDCPVTPWSMWDRDQAVAIGRGVFSPLMWKMLKHEAPDVISVGWFLKDGSAVVHSHYVQLDCGYNGKFVKSFMDDWNMDAVFSGYESRTFHHCNEEVDGLDRTDVSLSLGDRQYHVAIYVEHISDTRLRITLTEMSVPLSSDLQAYFRDLKPLYPELKFCVGEPSV